MLNFDISELSIRCKPQAKSFEDKYPAMAKQWLLHKSILGFKKSVRGCILVLLKSHLRANRPNPNITGWMEAA